MERVGYLKIMPCYNRWFIILHNDEDVSVNYVYYVKKEKFSHLLEKFFDGSILCKHEKGSKKFFPTSQEQLEKVFMILDK